MKEMAYEDKCARIIANNLRRILQDAGKSQSDVCRDLKLNKATLSSWMNGTRIPRMPKIDLLCHYFNITRADIMEERVDDEAKTTSAEVGLSPDESSLLEDYRVLNDDGREQARMRVHELTELKRYIEKKEEDI